MWLTAEDGLLRRPFPIVRAENRGPLNELQRCKLDRVRQSWAPGSAFRIVVSSCFGMVRSLSIR